jgi:hypothetical protein
MTYIYRRFEDGTTKRRMRKIRPTQRPVETSMRLEHNAGETAVDIFFASR